MWSAQILVVGPGLMAEARRPGSVVAGADLPRASANSLAL
ncbi:hypothetical protein BBAL3_1826 [Brevundimonas sp. BAL3]|nr:hypothetical protein BBAL3_1826 [Brevundimonas sp. BAL3]